MEAHPFTCRVYYEDTDAGYRHLGLNIPAGPQIDLLVVEDAELKPIED